MAKSVSPSSDFRLPKSLIYSTMLLLQPNLPLMVVSDDLRHGLAHLHTQLPFILASQIPDLLLPFPSCFCSSAPIVLIREVLELRSASKAATTPLKSNMCSLSLLTFIAGTCKPSLPVAGSPYGANIVPPSPFWPTLVQGPMEQVGLVVCALHASLIFFETHDERKKSI